MFHHLTLRSPVTSGSHAIPMLACMLWDKRDIHYDGIQRGVAFLLILDSVKAGLAAFTLSRF